MIFQLGHAGDGIMRFVCDFKQSYGRNGEPGDGDRAPGRGRRQLAAFPVKQTSRSLA
jgi:hypothetical protein